MKKRILSLALVVVMVALVAAGSLAYFTDTEKATNVMTVGQVDITLTEELAEPLYLLPTEYEMGKALNNKVVSIENTGDVDAWVRTIVAIEHTDPNGTNNGAGGIAWKMNTVSGDADYKAQVFYGALDYVQIGDKYYSVQLFTHQNPLEPDETTVPVKGFFLSENATEADLEGLKVDEDGNYEYSILVLTQAVQATNNDATTAEEALNEAFGVVSDANAATVAGWFANS